MASQHQNDQSSQENLSWVEKNRAHWDKVAATYNSTHTQKEFGDLINKINALVIQNIDWIGVPFLDPATNFEAHPNSSNHSVRILDYACGPGTITAILAGYATEYIGIDLSEKMVEQYNMRFNGEPSAIENSYIPTEKVNAHAVVGDFLDSKGIPSNLQDPKFYNFDLAVVSGGFHHFDNVELATQRLVDRLRPGGVLMIFDFLSHAPDDLHDHPAVHTIAHHGFTKARVHELFNGAGLKDVEIKLMEGKILLRGSASREGFLARGKKP